MSIKPSILYVDDERPNLTSFQFVFRDRYTVFIAESAKEALQILENNDIPILITDQRMPDITGVGLLKMVREKFPHCIRMILTGYSDYSAIVDSINDGNIFHYFSKPWDEQEMEMVIGNALELVALQRKLEFSQQQVSDMFDFAPDAMLAVDVNGVITSFNQYAEIFFGYSSNEIVGETVEKLIPPSMKEIHIGKRTGYSAEFGRKLMGRDKELFAIRKDGKEVSVEVSLSPMRGEEKLEILAAIRDVTERKTAEKAIKESEIKLRSLNDTLEARVKERTAELKNANEIIVSSEQRVQLLRFVASAGNAADNVPQVLKIAIDKLAEYMGWPVGFVFVPSRNNSGELLPLDICHNELNNARFNDLVMQSGFCKGEGLPGLAWATMKPVWDADLTREQDSSYVQAAIDVGLRSGFAFPITTNNETAAVLVFYSKLVIEPTSDLIALVHQIGIEVGFVIARKQVERELIDSEQRFRSVTNSAAEVIVATDDVGRILSWNLAGEHVFGYTAEEIIGKPIWQLVPERDRDKQAQALQRFQNGATGPFLGKTLSITALDKNNCEFPVEISTGSWDVEEKRYFSAIIRDISLRKKTEEALVRHSEWERLFSKLSTGFIGLEMADVDREIERALEQIAIFTDVDSGSILLFDHATGRFSISHLWQNEKMSQKREDLQNLPIDQIGTLFRSLKRGKPISLESIDMLPDSAKEERQYAKSRGIGAFINIPLFLKGELVGALGFSSARHPRVWGAQDVTMFELTAQMIGNVFYRQKIENELVIARDYADEANESKSAFLAAMSHEIRTPMNGVIGMIDLLSQTTLEIGQRQMLETARDSAFGLLNIIDDILDFSKIEAGKMTLESIPVSIRSIVESVVEALAPSAKRKGLKFFTYIDPQIPEYLLGDEVRLRQILFNLGGNAIKFTNNANSNKVGQVIIRVEMNGTSSETETLLHFRIIDNGIGMSDRVVEQLFQPFTQADSATTRKYGGSGLGLSICHRLVALMGGGIYAESKHGAGSTFNVKIALKHDEDVKDRKLSEAGSNFVGIKALIVSLSELANECLTSYLSYWKVDCEHAVDGGEALLKSREALKSGHPYDIIVLDDCWSMEERREIKRKFKDSIEFSSIRFVVLSSEDESQMRIDFPDSVVVKSNPMRRSSFLAGVAVALGRESPEQVHVVETDTIINSKAPSIEQALQAGQLILVAEDNEINQDVIIKQLNLLGYAAEIAANGKEALKLWKEKPYALLLTDCHMPEMDGFELTRQIRREQEAQKGHPSPIIAITANALQGEAERCIAVGMDDYLAKPVELMDLKRIVEKWMEGSSLQQTIDEASGAMEPAASSDNRAYPVEPTALGEILGDDRKVHFEFLNKYIKITPVHIDDLHFYCRERDLSKVLEITHRLKSSAGSIGAYTLADIFSEIEESANKGDWVLIEKLDADIDPVMNDVIEYVTKLEPE